MTADSSHSRSRTGAAGGSGASASLRPGAQGNGREVKIVPAPANSKGPSIAAAADSQRAATPSEGPPANFDSERTVISKQTPVSVAVSAGQLPPAEMGRVLQGQKLGHYELREFVGGGGMGAVFRAHDTMLDRTVAVKVLSQAQSSDEETLKRFKNEAQSAARLDHGNIGRVHYVGEDQGWHYIVFEFIDGINLRDLVERDGPLPLAEAVSFTLQVADALAHASERDVVHRDIKPSNVLITPGGRAKLVDMGLARLHQVEHSGNDLTASGVTLGTFDYISPEQARDPRNADVRSDIYSLGCTLYFLLTGRPPFPDGTVLQKLLQHQGEEPLDPRGFRNDLPDELDKILRKMLAKSPNQRYQRPVALMRDLLALAAKYELPVSATISPLSAATGDFRPALVRHLPWLASVGILLLAVLIVALLSRSNSADTNPPPIRHSPAIRDGSRSGSAPDGNSRTVTTAARASPPETLAATDKQQPKTISPDGARYSTDDDRPGETRPTKPLTPQTALENPRGGQPPPTGGDAAKGSPSAGDPSVAKKSGENIAPETISTPRLLAEVASRVSAEFDVRSWLERRLGLLSGRPITKDSNRSSDSPMANEIAVEHKLDDVPSSSRPKPETMPPLERKGMLVVSRSHEGPGEFGSLAEACRSAKTGDLIELRFDGRLDSRSIILAGQRLTIRAGDGFHPVINFVSGEADLSKSHSLISLGGGQLSLINLQIEWALSPDIAGENLSLAEIRPGESLRFDNCAVTIRNASGSDPASAYHPDVAFFELRAVPGPGVMAANDGPMIRPAAALQLKNCIARGEAVFLRANELQPAQVTWENGLLATSERLLVATGGPSDPKPQGQLQIELRHVTALTTVGLAQLVASQDSPQQLPLQLDARDCIFVGNSAAPLIEQSGVDEPEDLRKRIVWNGDRNFYEHFPIMWRMTGPGGAETSVQMTLADWKSFWDSREIHPVADQIAWRKPAPPAEAIDRHVPSDYELRESDNPARAASTDGHDAGFVGDQLPRLEN